MLRFFTNLADNAMCIESTSLSNKLWDKWQIFNNYQIFFEKESEYTNVTPILINPQLTGNKITHRNDNLFISQVLNLRQYLIYI